MLFLVGAMHGAVDFRQSEFSAAADGLPSGWKVWSPRPEAAPRTYLDSVHSLGEPGALAISGDSNAGVCGGWERLIEGVEPGKWYRLTAHYRAEGITEAHRQIIARLEWRSAAGKRAGQPEYAYRAERQGEWTRLTLEAAAPAAANAVTVQLHLWHAPAATLWWDAIALESIPTPAPRAVTIASIHYRPSKTGSAAANVEKFAEVIERVAPEKTDLILLPEGITVVGTGLNYLKVAEPVPGPTTVRLGETARRKNAYIVAGIYEREGSAVYNTAILLDRSGRLAGKYRKVYLPREETEGGLTPGSDYPVYTTDFGKIGMMICWDVQYADPARALAMRGAEIVLMPIWGGNETLGLARAIENHVFLVSSGYNYPTRIVDPLGEVLATTIENGTAAIATVDLNRRYADNWLGHMRGRFHRELRLDVPVAPPDWPR